MTPETYYRRNKFGVATFAYTDYALSFNKAIDEAKKLIRSLT